MGSDLCQYGLKIKIFEEKTGGKSEKEINAFMEDKDVYDIKVTSDNSGIKSFTVIYKD